jgi:hypothetical protein
MRAFYREKNEELRFMPGEKKTTMNGFMSAAEFSSISLTNDRWRG